MEKTCPSSDILSRFAAATLSDDEADAVVAHLAVCEACARTVDEMELKPAPEMLVAYRNLKDNSVETGEADTPLPKKIGQYEILQQIGHGGMGVVYRAVHPHLKREVALKVIRDSRLGDPAARERFVQEMQSLGKLTHPNIVHANDAGIDDDTPFIVTELLDGQDLGSYIEEHGKMPIKQAVDCIRQAATGLAYAHKAGYVHRDIKPSNLFLTRDGVVKILDLGIARQADSNIVTGQTMTGHVVGSPDFMAPEQFRSGPVDARSDIYSLGHTFAYLLTGKVQIDNTVPLPARLKPVLARMTAGLPGQRFQTADEIIPAIDRSGASRKRLRYLAIAVLCVALCFLGFVAANYRSSINGKQNEVPVEEEAEDASPRFGAVDIWNDYFIDEGASNVSEFLLNRLDLNWEPVDAAQVSLALERLLDYDMRHKNNIDETERNRLVREVTRELNRVGIGTLAGHPLDLSNPNDGLLAKAVGHFKQSESDRQSYLKAKAMAETPITDADIRHYIRLGNERYQQLINAKPADLDQPTPWENMQSATKAIVGILENNVYGDGAAAAKRKALEAAERRDRWSRSGRSSR